MTYHERIEHKLHAAFAPEVLQVIDESEAHRGHGGYREGGETHFRVVLRAASLTGKSRVQMQRAIYACLKEELDERVHALALDVKPAD